MKNTLTKWNVLDAILNIAILWEKVTPQAIAGCFRHAEFYHNDRDVTNEDEMDVENELPEPDGWNRLTDSNITVDCDFQDFIAVMRANDRCRAD
ncbi:hypothetical protein PR048_028796 [Dryococelus australis]|uniref:Uncharacterized protein n=1 Tax=Dryococelus australis TaxID=614101 RepID=A0ABQ9GEB6_9NEOP|nr:hypothetical protein PR048_028796 [Dryococelus australis]